MVDARALLLLLLAGPAAAVEWQAAVPTSQSSSRPTHSNRSNNVSDFVKSFPATSIEIDYMKVSSERNRAFSGGRVKTLANRVFLTQYFGKPSVVGMKGDCSPEEVRSIFAGATSALHARDRLRQLRNDNDALLCYPIKTELSAGRITLIVPTIVDADQIWRILTDIRSNRSSLDSLAVSEIGQTGAARWLEVPLGPTIEMRMNAQIDVLMSDLSRLETSAEMKTSANGLVAISTKYR